MSLASSKLPGPLRLLGQVRFASSESANHGEFPFPCNSNPSAHEIFHLPRGASQSQIKARYYQLVRIHHPDCITARHLPPSISHSRFQAISDAYASLSGKKPSTKTWSDDKAYNDEVLRRKRAQWRASAGSDEFGYPRPAAWEARQKARWDQGVLIFIVTFALTASILPISLLSPFANRYSRHDRAAKNLSDARREARDVAEVRRVAMMHQRESSDVSNKVFMPESGSKQ
ncbi:hypothetical protein BU17DRAFT_45694 [Hysterangium stoloniferum]|nr:hypothetical protein BU17DRAFT_45694 [Hysterangium stoloniferum]